MEWQLIESDSAVQQLLAEAARSDAVAVDTEFMRRNTFFPQVALLQLCFSDRAWLIDPLTLRDTTPLAELLTDTSTLKVLHSPSEDLEVFRRWLGELPSPLFDTQRAAALVNRGFGLGYRALVHDICEVDLPKGETRSDWLKRPLTDSQCEYAAQDVAWLLPVYQVLREECEQQGKLDWVLADGEDALQSAVPNGTDYYRRIKNAWKLDQHQLSALIAVCQWREETARARDKPRGWIIDDRACLQLAQSAPRNRAQLQAAVDMAPGAIRRHADELLALLAQQRELPGDALPPRLPAPLPPSARQRLKLLKEKARQIAATLDVAPEILLRSSDYEILLRESMGEAVEIPSHWGGWRNDTVIAPLRQLVGEAQ